MAGWRNGYALPGVVYKSPELYEDEIRRIFLQRLALRRARQARSRQRGDYFLFEMAGESVIVVRDAEGNINALLNVCRHRGSRICDALTGHESAAHLPLPRLDLRARRLATRGQHTRRKVSTSRAIR